MGRRSQDNPIDWELIRKEYRLDQMSLRQMATKFNVQASAISRKAAKEQWVKDKSVEVRTLSESQLLQSNAPKATAKATPTAEDIEIAATARTNIILDQRTDIQRTKRLTMTLLEELEVATSDNALLRDLANLMYSPDKNGVDKLNELYTKIIAMPGRVDSMKKLAETLKTLIALEREAFGIDAGKKEDGGAEAFLKRLAGANVDLS